MITRTESVKKSTAWWLARNFGKREKIDDAVRIVAVRLERHDAGLLRQPERLVHHPEHLEIVLLARAAP